jgi:aminopeptidase N
MSKIGAGSQILVITLSVFAGALQAQDRGTFGSIASGGVLSPQQAKYDVKYYDLNLKIDPGQRHLAGFVEIMLESAAAELDTVELDLINLYRISKIERDANGLTFTHRDHKVKISLESKLAKGSRTALRVYYSGNPPAAALPPWQGGFNWSLDSTSGTPWVGVSCQGEGAKIWWPCKDHPSDEPDSVAINITVPDTLYCATNGLLEKLTVPEPGWKTFHWKTRYPVNNYNVSINIGNYAVVRRPYRDSNGEMDIVFYILKQDSAKAPEWLAMAEEYLRFYSRYFGDYPWSKEKFGLAHTHYLGMEHQTINAYGNHFRKNDRGYDWLMLHEMGHEWWGNFVTVRDWADFWIHEGICTYAEALFVNEKFGREAYHSHLRERARYIRNRQPIVPKPNATTSESYSNDVYFKAALMLHTLSYLIGDAPLLDILKTFATDPAYTMHNRVVTQDFVDLAQRKSGKDLSWFFKQYLYTAALPTLEHKIIRKPGKPVLLELRWREKDFHLPVEIRASAGDSVALQRYEVTSKKKRYQFPENANLEFDPARWILMETAEIE